jgi:hypothetical protein
VRRRLLDVRTAPLFYRAVAPSALSRSGMAKTLHT